MNTRVSVIIPTYNRSEMVIRAIESALQAIQPGDEILVINDGSTDNTLPRLESYKNKIKVINATHKGAGATRNLGIQEAKGNLIAFLDSDDVWMPDHLMLHRSIHEMRPDIAFSFSDFTVRDANHILHRNFIQHWHKDPRPWEDILSSSIKYNDVSVYIGDLSLPHLMRDFVPTFTLVAKREAIEDTHWFAESVSTFEDLQCFGRLSFAGPAAFVNKETATQYGHLMGRLTDESAIKKIKIRIQIYEEIWGQQHSFMALHEDQYNKRINELNLLLVRCLLKEGFTAEARHVLKSLERSPMIYRLLACLPMPLEQMLEVAWSILKFKF